MPADQAAHHAVGMNPNCRRLRSTQSWA